MSDLQRYTAASSSRGISRQAARALAGLNAGTELVIAETNNTADEQSAKIDAMAGVTQRGLQGAAFMTQVEQQLAQAVPSAAGRLQAIGDVGTLGLTQLVMDTAIRLRRI